MSESKENKWIKVARIGHFELSWFLVFLEVPGLTGFVINHIAWENPNSNYPSNKETRFLIAWKGNNISAALDTKTVNQLVT